VKGTIENVMDSVKTAVVGTTDTVKSTLADARDGVSDVVTAGAHNGSDALSRARAGVSATMHNVNASVQNVNDRVGERLRNADVAGSAKRTVGAAQENPIGLAIAALAIGFLTGSLLPVSETERRRFGPMRDKIVGGAQATGSELLEAGKAVVAETAQTAAATALNSAKTHGQDVVDAAQARVHENEGTAARP
jgi:ElaB/YqjD/DUF883 family membrane-anchored ribosome-binding protein